VRGSTAAGLRRRLPPGEPSLTPVEQPLSAAPELALRELDPLLRAALAEDLGGGDRTSEVAVGASARARGELAAKSAGVLAGLHVFARVFALLDPAVRCELLAQDGARVSAGAVLARLEGPARALLAGERTALNFVQRLSGVATLTARFVDAAGGRARLLDTRKTTPGLRRLEKYAVRCGGGENHRFGLFDEAMLKDNHLDLARRPVAELVAELRQRSGAAFRVTVEARTPAEALAAAASGADVVLLDNMTPAELSALAPRLRAAAPGPLELEASGGITLANVALYAASGVDRVSVGALTHTAPALDLSLKLRPLARGEEAT
jgi:nicotinate-nucleotide pyrophosphorylase (carboxylating)